MARQKRSVSDDYVNKVKAVATKVLEDWEKSPSSYAECKIQKITLERWAKAEHFPSTNSEEILLNFLKLTRKRWNEFLDGKIDFDTFWALRGKELEDRVITWQSVVNDAGTLTHDERMLIIQELAKITTDTIEKVELFSLTNQQLKRLNTLLITSRGNLGDDDLKAFETIINKGVSQSLVASILDQKIVGFPKKEFDMLATFLLKPSRWVGDTLLGVTNHFLTNFEDLIDALGS
jgi:hypothetical protein